MLPEASAAILSAYTEPLVRGRRVAVLGDVSLGLAARVADRGARLVHAYDPSPARVAEAIARAGRGGPVTYAVLEGELGVRDGAFDVVIVPDLSIFEDPTSFLRRVRRLVSHSGAAIIASPNPERARGSKRRVAALGYYALYDVVSLQFTLVRMAGQAPFAGYTVADFAPEGEPEVTVDTSLQAGSVEPEWFIAVGSEHPVELESYSVIELPAIAPELLAPAATAGRENDDRVALVEAQTRLAMVTTELETLRERQRDKARQPDGEQVTTAALSTRLSELEAELGARQRRVEELEVQAGHAERHVERITQTNRDFEQELRAERDRAAALASQVEGERGARQRAERELTALRGAPAPTGDPERIQALTAELVAANTRATELELAVTQRAPVVVPEPRLAARIVELEEAMRDAQREVTVLSAQRDEAAARLEAAASRADEQASRASELAAKLQKAERDRARVSDDAARLKASAERDLAALRERAEALTAQKAEADRLVAELRQRPAELPAGVDEVDTLERALAERGRVVAGLQRDLRESERVGRELVDALALAHGEAMGEEPEPAEEPAASEPDEETMALRRRLDALAVKAAKCEAELQAASWRNVQLEQRLAELKA